MRIVQAILEPDRLQAVTALLAEAEIHRMTVSEVHGVSDMASLADEQVSPEPMVRIEVGVNDDFVARAIAAIEQAGGDRGRIFTWELHDVIRIRTGETGPEAI
ncbi:MAG: nitrogen regulatory protein P-II [Planctomycetota bacterium]|nr:MAG: nitrogen regulatory protein P-II [Planctomycetota bacterium]